MTAPVAERRIAAHGMTLAARHWRQTAAAGSLPVIAIHGWLDNAISFDALAQSLPDVEVLALDLPGHGFSDHKHLQGTYNIWDDHLQILAAADACGWDRFILIGHSRGAVIATLLAAAMPERIAGLVCLDGFLPFPQPAEQMPQQLGKFLRDYLRAERNALRAYDSVDDAVAARVRAVPTRDDSARALMARALTEQDGKYFWRSDRRLRYASAIKLTAPECDAVLEALTMPVQLILSEHGYAKWNQNGSFSERNANIREVTLPGSHHQHMEEEAGEIAALIGNFAGEISAALASD